MAYYETIYLVKGDTHPELNLTLLDSNTAREGETLDEADSTTWQPIDTTGAVVTLIFKGLGETTPKSSLVMSKHAPLTDGRVFTDFPTGTLDTAGTFVGEVKIVYADGGIHTVYDQFKFKIR